MLVLRVGNGDHIDPQICTITEPFSIDSAPLGECHLLRSASKGKISPAGLGKGVYVLLPILN
jgi:hypothetical protein